MKLKLNSNISKINIIKNAFVYIIELVRCLNKCETDEFSTLEKNNNNLNLSKELT